jgi:hypothetical protein
MKVSSILPFFALILMLGVDALAQSSRGVAAAGRRIDDFNVQTTKAQRDAMAREMRRRKPTKEELQHAARIRAETKEDLEGLQALYNEIVTKGATPPNEFVRETSEKVRKHAVRLKANILFPDLEDNAQEQPDVSGESRKLLHDLCTNIYELLTNPMIENPQVLDLSSATKARNAIDAIIAISGELTKR